MIVSSKDVKQFLLELIEQANYPGKMIEFVVSVKHEVAASEVSDLECTGSARMVDHGK